jgi:Alpha/beta hydrolase domain
MANEITASPARSGLALASILALVAIVSLAWPVTSASASETFEVPDLPEVEGPFDPPGIDDFELAQPESVEDFGYMYEEYLVSGMAAGSSYEVRLLVARPQDLGEFSGSTLVEPKHPIGVPFVWNFTRLYLMSRGHASVELSTIPSTIGLLQSRNPERYAGLHVTEEQSSDIFAQVGRLLKSGQSPLPEAETLYMTGHSRSAGPTWPYMDTHHERFRLENGDPIYDAFFPETSRTAARFGPFPDVDVPTLQLNSQLEVEEVFAQDGIDYRKPDGKRFRLYEVAGMPHHDSRVNPFYQGEPCDLPLNRFPYKPIVNMALDHLIHWVEDGVSPPHADRISVIGGPGGEIELDEHGNAVGGVRTTYVDVPHATHSPLNSGPDPNCLPLGSQQPFSADKLFSLYGSHANYVRLVGKRLDKLVSKGWYLPEYAPELRAEAAAFDGFEGGGSP